MDLEDWELLPQDGVGKSVGSKASSPLYPRCATAIDDCLDSSIILLDDPRKTTLPDERIVREIDEPKPAPTPPTSTPVFLDTTTEDCGFVEESEKEVVDARNTTDGKGGKTYLNSEFGGKGYRDGGGVSLWGWRITGVGTLCTLGVAAAALCVLIIGGRGGRQRPQHEKIQFQIYTDDKDLKQVVQHATRLNQAISTARGVTVTRANISFGGNYAAP